MNTETTMTQNGISTTLGAGQEKYETFNVARIGTRVQYDYRAVDGALFSCCAKTLEEAHAFRDQWLKRR